MRVLDAMPSSNLKPENEEEPLEENRVYRTTYMFSATMPAAVERLARKYLRRPVVVTIGTAGRAADNVTQRVGIAVGTRFQFDTADWTVQPPNGRGPTKDNPLANLLLYGRIYYAFTPHGFAPTGVVGSAFVGGGGGQIEPKPGLPASARYPSAHVVSGFGNAHVGGRVEYGLRNGFHVAGELTLHFMFPTFLFNADVAALVGFHF
jgi:hypothetical protein